MFADRGESVADGLRRSLGVPSSGGWAGRFPVQVGAVWPPRGARHGVKLLVLLGDAAREGKTWDEFEWWLIRKDFFGRAPIRWERTPGGVGFTWGPPPWGALKEEKVLREAGVFMEILNKVFMDVRPVCRTCRSPIESRGEMEKCLRSAEERGETCLGVVCALCAARGALWSGSTILRNRILFGLWAAMFVWMSFWLLLFIRESLFKK